MLAQTLIIRDSPRREPLLRSASDRGFSPQAKRNGKSCRKHLLIRDSFPSHNFECATVLLKLMKSFSAEKLCHAVLRETCQKIRNDVQIIEMKGNAVYKCQLSTYQNNLHYKLNCLNFVRDKTHHENQDSPLGQPTDEFCTNYIHSFIV